MYAAKKSGQNRVIMTVPWRLSPITLALPFLSCFLLGSVQATVAVVTTVKGNWKQISGKLTDDALMKTESSSPLLGKLQAHYGLVKDRAEQYLKDLGQRLIPLARMGWNSIPGCDHGRVMMSRVLIVAADLEDARISEYRARSGPS